MFTKRYKCLVCFLVLSALSSNLLAQKQDTISVYEYIDYYGNNWKIEIYNQDSVEFLGSTSKFSSPIQLVGKLQAFGDTSVRFVRDNLNENNKVYMRFVEADSSFSKTIKLVARGNINMKIGDYYIPCSEDSLSKNHLLPKAKYISGNDEGTSIIEFNKNKTFTIRVNGCKLRLIEKGSFVLSDNLINLRPFKKQKHIHRLVTINDQFFVYGDYLVAITFTTRMEDSKLSVIKKYSFFKDYFSVFKEDIKR